MNIVGVIVWFLLLVVVLETSMQRCKQFPFDPFYRLLKIFTFGIFVVSVTVAIGSLAGLPR